MVKIKEKHPSWFKMKIERRQLVKQLPPENAVNVLLACWDYLETGKMPTTLSAFEKIAVSAFLPDLEEAWAAYTQRITARKGKQSADIDRYHTVSTETEVETEEENNLKVISSTSTGRFKNGDAALNGRPPTPFPIDPDTGECIDREVNA